MSNGSSKVVNAIDSVGLSDSSGNSSIIYLTANDNILILENSLNVNRSLEFYEIIYNNDYGSFDILYKPPSILSVSDYLTITDGGSYININTVSVSDHNIVYDYMPIAKNRAIIASEYNILYGYVIASRRNPISVSDYKMIYDYVPSMDPTTIHYMAIYTNPTEYSILISDYSAIVDYAVATIKRKAIAVLDVMVIKDGVSMAKRSVTAYDKLVVDNILLNNA